MSKTHEWLGRPIFDEADAHDLETSAAKNEFIKGMKREDAEGEAHSEYRKKHHAKAAAYHYQGMKRARSAGSTDASKQHAEMYNLHIRAMDHDPMSPVPPEVEQHVKGAPEGDEVKFKPHKADQFLLMEKSEDGGKEVLDRARKEIRACIGAGKHLKDTYPGSGICSHCNWSSKIRTSVAGGGENPEHGDKKPDLKIVKSADLETLYQGAKFALEQLEKASQNVKDHRVGSGSRFGANQRIATLAGKMGVGLDQGGAGVGSKQTQLTVDEGKPAIFGGGQGGDGRGGYPFEVAHDLSHIATIPKGDNPIQHQKWMDSDDSGAEQERDETIVSNMLPGIQRRAGITPQDVRTDTAAIDTRHISQEQAHHEAKRALSAFEEGRKAFNPQGVMSGPQTVHGKINERAHQHFQRLMSMGKLIVKDELVEKGVHGISDDPTGEKGLGQQPTDDTSTFKD